MCKMKKKVVLKKIKLKIKKKKTDMKTNKQKSLLYKKNVSFFFPSSLGIIHPLEKSLLCMDLVIFIPSVLSFVMTVMGNE